MKNKDCYLCHGTILKSINGKVRDMPDMKILRCRDCGLVFLESFDHIDDNYYENSQMRANDLLSDWEEIIKECLYDDLRRAEQLDHFIENKSVLDFGCGAGGFLMQIKDTVLNCAGFEKEKNMRDILFNETGLKVYSGIDEIEGKFDVITLFHVLEHFKDPKDILKKLSEHLNPSGSIIIEVPNSDDALLTLYDCKPFSEFIYWSPHLYLFNNHTLKKLIEGAGLSVDYMKQIQRFSLSNHLYWLAQGSPDGHKIWHSIDSPELNKAYETQLAKLGKCDTIIVSVSNVRNVRKE